MNGEHIEAKQQELLDLRRQAEQRLAEQNLPSQQFNSMQDAQRLIAELQVHQIELEMQNDEMRKMQEQLSLEREKYADLYNFAPIAYFIFNDQDIILDLNLAAAEMLGNERKYLTGHPLTAYITPDSLQTFMAHRQQALETRHAQTCELTLRPRDGSPLHVQARTVALFATPGEAQLWRSVMTDITERKQAEEKLNYQAQLLGSVFDAIIATDHELRITRWNHAAETLYGWTEAEVLGKHVDEVCATEFIHQTQAEAQATLLVEKNWRGELRQKRCDGSQLWVIASVSLLQDSQGNFIGGVTINHDITARKQAEGRLQESQILYESLVNVLHQNLYRTDPNGKLLFVNQQLQKNLGLPLEQILGKTAYDFYPEDLARKYRADDQIVIQSGSPLTIIEENISPDTGEKSFVEVVKLPVFDKEGNVNGIQGIFWDITERKRAEEALQESEIRFRTIAEQMTDMVFLTDMQGVITYVSPIAQTMFGFGLEQMAGRPFTAFLVETDIAHALQAFTETITEGRPTKSIALRMKRRDDTEFVGELSAVFVQQKNISGTIGVIHDITERKRQEAALKIRLELLEFAVNHSLGDLMQKALDEICDFANSPIGFYHFVESDQKTLVLQAWSTRTLQEFCHAEGKHMHYPIDEAGVWVECVRQRKPVIHNDYASLPASRRKGLPDGHAQVIRELVVPIFRDEQVVAILGIGNKPTDYNEEDVETISYLADVVWEIVKRKQAEEELTRATEQLSLRLAEIEQLQEELREQAIRDSLTGLYNRRYMEDAVMREFVRAARENYPLSVIMMDMDKLKFLNDTYGHHTGDLALQTLANCLRAFTRADDIVCRYGGDEFNIVMSRTEGRDAFKRVEEWQQYLADHPIQVDETTSLPVQFSAGIACFPAQGKTPDEVTRSADAALYRAKENGRNCAVLYE